jgi:putative membrane protein
MSEGGRGCAERAHPSREPLVLLVLTALFLVGSGIRPVERGTWWLEVAPVLIGAAILITTYKRFRLSPLLYRLLFLHAVILMVGGHYTYARVPAGFWVQDWLELSRNHYDRLGHLAQGFIPAILARELLIRLSPLHRGRWLAFIVVSICLAFSAFYEMIEWWAALLGGSSAESFLGTQGDVWDTQWDMFLALSGALLALGFVSRLHDRSMKSVTGL